MIVRFISKVGDMRTGTKSSLIGKNISMIKKIVLVIGYHLRREKVDIPIFFKLFFIPNTCYFLNK